jgi:hypothetical protein
VTESHALEAKSRAWASRGNVEYGPSDGLCGSNSRILDRAITSGWPTILELSPRFTDVSAPDG